MKTDKIQIRIKDVKIQLALLLKELDNLEEELENEEA